MTERIRKLAAQDPQRYSIHRAPIGLDATIDAARATSHVQKTAGNERIAGDVSKSGLESNMSDAETLLRDARGAIWQPSNPDICKRIDDFLDAARKEGK